MAFFKDDAAFQFEFLRVLSHARYRGSDVAEVLALLSEIKTGDMESWYLAFLGLAQRVEKSAGAVSPLPKSLARRVAGADRWFAASNYYRTSDFFLHGHPEDPRIKELWIKQAECFDNALKMLGNGKKYTLQADGFKVPIIYFKAPRLDGVSWPRPTLIAGNGYDGSMEEILHVVGFAAMERGYNVIVYEGPGQCTVRREQDLAFIADWERAVTPVVDFAVQQSEVDAKRIALFGYSLGGYLSVRAAAFEPRIAAVLAIDGVYDFNAEFRKQHSPSAAQLLADGDIDAFDKAYSEAIFDPATPTLARWGMQHGLWVFKADKVSEMLEKVKPFTLQGVIDRVKCPVYVGDAEKDIYFREQPALLAEALGDKATLRLFTEAEGAGAHCQAGALSLLNEAIFNWLDDKLAIA